MLSGYLDPASGSAIFSAVAAGAAGAGVAAKTIMAKMRLKKRTLEEPDTTTDDTGKNKDNASGSPQNQWRRVSIVGAATVAVGLRAARHQATAATRWSVRGPNQGAGR